MPLCRPLSSLLILISMVALSSSPLLLSPNPNLPPRSLFLLFPSDTDILLRHHRPWVHAPAMLSPSSASPSATTNLERTLHPSPASLSVITDLEHILNKFASNVYDKISFSEITAKKKVFFPQLKNLLREIFSRNCS